MTGDAVRSLLIAELPDEIDVTNCAAIADGLLTAVGSRELVIADMTGTAFCDSASMRMLLAVHERARVSGSVLRVAVRPGGSVARMMGLLGMNRILSIYESVEAALPTRCGAKAVGYVRRARMPELAARRTAAPSPSPTRSPARASRDPPADAGAALSSGPSHQPHPPRPPGRLQRGISFGPWIQDKPDAGGAGSCTKMKAPPLVISSVGAFRANRTAKWSQPIRS